MSPSNREAEREARYGAHPIARRDAPSNLRFGRSTSYKNSLDMLFVVFLFLFCKVQITPNVLRPVSHVPEPLVAWLEGPVVIVC